MPAAGMKIPEAGIVFIFKPAVFFYQVVFIKNNAVFLFSGLDKRKYMMYLIS